MAVHVDILKVDPMAGVERVLARISLDEHGHIFIDAADPEYWREALARATHLDPDDDPEHFLYSLSERLDGTYIIATEPHGEEACEYAPAPDLGATPA